MLRTVRPLVGVALVVAVVMGACPAARAQLHGSFHPQMRGSVARPLNPFLANPNFFVAPGLTLNQAAFNIRVLGSAYRSVPPYALGYNPYIHSVNYGSMSPYLMPYSSYGSSMYSMPYSYGMSSGYGGGSYGGGYGAAPMANYDASSSSGAESSPYALRTSTGYGQGQSAGGPLAGLLNDEGKLDWPLALRILPPGPQVTQLRQQMDARASELQRETATGQVNPALARELSQDVDTLRSLLADRAESLPVSQQALTEARRFLHKLQDTLQTVR